MSFEEEFPSLKEKTGWSDEDGFWEMESIKAYTWNYADSNSDYLEVLSIRLVDIMECCLDKQRVREEIQKYISKQGYVEVEGKFLLKQLGLEDEE